MDSLERICEEEHQVTWSTEARLSVGRTRRGGRREILRNENVRLININIDLISILISMPRYFLRG